MKSKEITIYSAFWALTFFITSLGLPAYSYGQFNLSLQQALTREFSKESKDDGRWEFYPEIANIKKIDKPLVRARIPAYKFYQVNLINHLGYHVNQGVCLVLFDSVKSKILLVEPMWYGGLSRSLPALLIGQKFGNKDSLLSFLTELNELMQIGSLYKFRLTSYTDDLVTYDLGYSKGDQYTTGGNGTSSTISYNSDGVWRKIRIDIKDFTIVQYTAINPAFDDTLIINKDTKAIKPQGIKYMFDTIPERKFPF
jgi:hypothetical protein